MSTTQLQRYLTHDEIISIKHKYRVRIWQGEKATPVVLASQIGTAGAAPSRETCKIANFVNEAILRHPGYGIAYFEAEVDRDVALVRNGEVLAEGPDGEWIEAVHPWKLTIYHFNYFGCSSHRLRMFRPTSARQQWSQLEEIVGGKIEQ